MKSQWVHRELGACLGLDPELGVCSALLQSLYETKAGMKRWHFLPPDKKYPQREEASAPERFQSCVRLWLNG